MGKSRRYNAYLSVSCSGPEESSVMRTPIGTIRSRAGADLKYTTADADFLYEHFKTPNADTNDKDIHVRLVNPKRTEVLNSIEDLSKQLECFSRNENWDGGCIHLIYAGHGRENNGALVFQDGDLSSDDFLNHVANHKAHDKQRLRIDVALDSCFSGAFLTSMLSYAFKHHEDILFPCSFFSAALHDEYAWEYPKYGHGIWTAAFFQQLKSPSLNTNRLLLITNVLFRRYTKAEKKELYNGGVSFMTSGSQHSFHYENGHFMIEGAGSFDLPDSKIIETEDLQCMLSKAREQNA